MAFPTPLAAQVTTEQKTAEPECELHIWPSNVMRDVHVGLAHYYAWAHGGTVDGAAKGRDGYPALPKELLSVERQLERLRALDVPRLTGLAGYRTVLHDQPLSSREIRMGTGRHAQGAPACYAELMIDTAVYQSSVVTGKFLNLLIRFRQFDAGAQPVRSFGTYVQQPLRLFPPAGPDVDPKPTLDEFYGAFDRNIAEFGQALQKPAKTRKR